jgi:hypothetical protein
MPGVLTRAVMLCPECGAEQLEAVTDREMTNFLCHACWNCWHVELGRVHRIDPGTCPGCLHLDECRSRRAAS